MVFGPSRKSATGIHVADGAVHIVELRRQRTETLVQHALRLALPAASGAVPLAEPARRDELATTLEAARVDRGVSLTTVYFALDSSGALLLRRPLVPGDAGASRELLRWEAEQALADDLAEYVIDYLVTRRQGFAVAARRVALDLLTETMGRAGVEKPGFDVVPFALCNALELSGALGGEGVEMLLHVAGTEATLIAVCDGGLEDVQILSLDSADPAPPVGANGDEGLFDDDADAPAASDAAPPQARQAIEEMACAQGGDGPPERLWLAGAAAAWEGSLAGLRPQVLDPLVGMERAAPDSAAAETAPPGALAVAAGLAFRALAEEG